MLPVPKAIWRVMLGETDLTDKLKPILLSLKLTEKRSGEADQLDLELDDRNDQIQMPSLGAVLSVSMGWERGENLPIGFIDKGLFSVDEVKLSGSPDKLIISAKSADFSSSFRKRRSRSFVGQTIKSVVSAIAAAHGLKSVIHPALQSKIIPALGFDAKSDAALLRELGTRFDATATVKNKSLLFSPIGQSQSATGSELTLKTIDRSMTEARYDYHSASRDTYTGVEAHWHNRSTAQKSIVVAGTSENAKRLKKTYASGSSALNAAEAELKRIRRAKASMNITLVYGRPDLFPDHPLSLTGFKSVINQNPWLVSEATHTLDASGGLTTALVLETKG